jgi:hypothetical protein
MKIGLSSFGAALIAGAALALSGAVLPAQGSEIGFLYSDGAYTSVAAPGAIYTNPSGINDASQVVGSFNPATGPNGYETATIRASFTAVAASPPSMIPWASTALGPPASITQAR